MGALKSPRLWLFVWGGLGALAVLYVIFAASVQPHKTGSAGRLHDPALVTGAMSKFEYSVSGVKAPDNAFQDGSGTASLDGFKGKVILVNFWATWCAPCVKELPSLDALEKKLGGKDFQVVAIAADPRGADKAADFLAKLGVRNLGHYADPTLRLASAVGGATVLPLTILYDRDGREIGRLRGDADWTSAEAERLIKAAIDRD